MDVSSPLAAASACGAAAVAVAGMMPFCSTGCHVTVLSSQAAPAHPPAGATISCASEGVHPRSTRSGHVTAATGAGVLCVASSWVKSARAHHLPATGPAQDEANPMRSLLVQSDSPLTPLPTARNSKTVASATEAARHAESVRGQARAPTEAAAEVVRPSQDGLQRTFAGLPSSAAAVPQPLLSFLWSSPGPAQQLQDSTQGVKHGGVALLPNSAAVFMNSLTTACVVPHPVAGTGLTKRGPSRLPDNAPHVVTNRARQREEAASRLVCVSSLFVHDVVAPPAVRHGRMRMPRASPLKYNSVRRTGGGGGEDEELAGGGGGDGGDGWPRGGGGGGGGWSGDGGSDRGGKGWGAGSGDGSFWGSGGMGGDDLGGKGPLQRMLWSLGLFSVPGLTKVDYPWWILVGVGDYRRGPSWLFHQDGLLALSYRLACCVSLSRCFLHVLVTTLSYPTHRAPGRNVAAAAAAAAAAVGVSLNSPPNQPDLSVAHCPSFG